MFGGFSQGFRGFSLEDSKRGFRGFRIQFQRIQKFHEDSGFRVLEDSGFRGFSVTRGFSTGFREDSERIQDSGIQTLYRKLSGFRIQSTLQGALEDSGFSRLSEVIAGLLHITPKQLVLYCIML